MRRNIIGIAPNTIGTITIARNAITTIAIITIVASAIITANQPSGMDTRKRIIIGVRSVTDLITQRPTHGLLIAANDTTADHLIDQGFITSNF